MKKALFLLSVIFGIAAFSVQVDWTADMPSRCRLDWRKNEKNVSALMRINLGKLSKAAGKQIAPENLAVSADGKLLQIQLADPESADGLTSLMFEVPGGTEKLHLYYGSEKHMGTVRGGNDIFAVSNGNLWQEKASSAGWLGQWFKPDPNKKYGSVSPSGKGTVFALVPTPQAYRHVFSRDFDIPSKTLSGSDVLLAMDFKSLARHPFNFAIIIHQFDDSGKQLDASVISPRNLTMVLPPDKMVNLRQFGRLDPRAKKLRLNISTLMYAANTYGRDGVADAKTENWAPKFQVDKLLLFAGRRIEFPGVNPAHFAEGIELGTKAISMDGKVGLILNYNPPAVVLDGVVPKNANEYHWPEKSGTVEFWFRPDWKKTQKVTPLFNSCDQGFRPSVSYSAADETLTFSFWNAGKKNVQKKIKTPIVSRAWHHFALTWDPEYGCVLYLDGVAVFKDASRLPVLNYAKISTPVNTPGNGGFGMFVDGNLTLSPEEMAKEPFFHGLMDRIRISDGIRYNGDFTPDKALKCDEKTRAFLDFENEYDGTHADGDGFVFTSIVSANSPFRDFLTVESRNGKTQEIRWNQDKVSDSINPSLLTTYWQTTAQKLSPKSADFNNARSVKHAAFTLQNGETAKIECKDGVITDYIELSCPPDGSSVFAPWLHHEGEVDSRTFAGITETLKLDRHSSDQAKAFRIFQYLIRNTDYFMIHPVEFDVNQPSLVSRKPLRWFNSYIAFQCNDLNQLSSAAMLNCIDLPVSKVPGTGHCIMQVFYDGGWHVYDLSAQTIFPARDGLSPASFEEIDRDPFLLARYRKTCFVYYMIWGRRGVEQWLSAMTDPAQKYVLNPGEKFRMSFFNNGLNNDILDGKTDDLQDAVDVTKQTNSAQKVIALPSRTMPEYGNGEFCYEGIPLKNNPAFRFADGCFTYKIQLPYVIAAAEVRITPIASLEISSDNGKTFRKLTPESDGAYRLDYPVRGRREYLLRVNAPAKNITNFRSRTFVQMNERVVPGELRSGENILKLQTDGGGKLSVNIRYRENSAPITLKGGVFSGIRKGAEKQLFVMEPDSEHKIEVNGIGTNAKLLVSNGLSAVLSGNMLTVRASSFLALGHVTVVDGERRKSIDILVMKNARLVSAEKIKPDSGIQRLGVDADSPNQAVKITKYMAPCVFSFEQVPAGKYVFFVLMRNATGLHLNGKNYYNLRLPYYLLKSGADGFLWNYPYVGSYPYRGIDSFNLPESGEFRLSASRGSEIAAFLLLPADNMLFVHKIRAYLTGINNNPALFAEMEKE